MSTRWRAIGAGALLLGAAACAGDSECLEAGKSRCAAICACSADARCAVTSTDGASLQTLYVDRHDCEVLAELVCLGRTKAADPACPAALEAAACEAVYEEDDEDLEDPIGALNLPPACR